ncbi:MAG: hypothetical protein AB7G17_00995 [Phycisphaerales bacterium]
MDPPPLNPLADMPKAEVAELAEHLTDYALRKMRKLSWRGVRMGAALPGGQISAPGGVSPCDLAAQAIERFLDGTRVWDPATTPDFRQFLRGVVDSLVSHLVKSIENRTVREAPVAAAAQIGAPYLESQVQARGLDAQTPLELCVDKDWRAKFQTAIFTEVEGDPLLDDLLQCFGAGLTPAETAELLSVPVEDVYNAQKRLARKLDKVCSKLARSAKL